VKDEASRNQLERIIETIAEGIYIINADAVIAYANESAEEILGVKRSDLMGRPYSDPGYKVTTLEGKPYQLEERPIIQALRTGKLVRNVEYIVIRPDGSGVIISANAAPLRDEQGNITGAILSFADITARKQAEEELREYERRFREMLEQVELIALILDARGNITFANDFLLDFTGWQREEVIGKSWFDYFVPEERREEIERVFHEIITKGTPAHYENDILTREGERRTIAFSNVLLFDRQRNVIGTASIGHDVTAERQAAEEIRESRRQVLDILESITDGFFALDNDWRFTYVNHKAAQLIGRRREELLFRNMWEAVPETVGTKFDEEYHRAVEEKTPVTFEVFYPLNKWFEVHAYPYENGLSVYVSDITERKRIEEALKESESRYRTLFEDAPVALWEQDASEITARINELKKQGVKDFRAYFEQHPEAAFEMLATIKIIDVNKAVLKLYGASSKEEFIRNLTTTFTKEGLDAAKEFLISYAERGEVKFEAEFPSRTFKGDIIQVSVISFIPPGYEETRSKIFIATVDITERKKAEEALKESEARFRKVFEDGPLGMAITGFDYRFIKVNARLSQMLGYTEEELTKLTFPEITHPEDVEKDISAAKKLVRGEVSSYQTEKRYIKKDGEPFWVSLTVSVVRDEKGKPIYNLTMVEDIEDRKRAEARLERAKELSDALNNINMTITSTLDFNEIMQRVVVESAKAICSEAAAIFLREGGYWVARYLYGIPRVPVGTRLTHEEAKAGELAARTKEPVVIDDAFHDERVSREVMKKYNIRSLLSVPLIARGNVAGMLYFSYHSAPVGFTEAQVDFVSKLKAVISLAMENAHLFDELKRSTEELDKKSKGLQTLIDVALDITSGLRLGELMRKITKHAAELSDADIGAVGLVNEETGVVTYMFFYNLPEITAETEVLPGTGMSAIVLSQKKPVILEDYQKLPQRIPIFVEAGLRAIAMVPLWSRGKIRGILVVSNKNPEKKFSEKDVANLEGISRHAAIALENARVYETERHIANTLQDALLAVPEKVNHLEYGTLYHSATEAARVGGDFYDLFELEHNRVGLSVGDVAGKGLEAAALTAVVKNTIRAYALEGYDPAEIMAKTNNVVKAAATPSMFVTVFFAIFDKNTRRLIYCSAGHPPAIIRRKSQTVELLEKYSPIIGAFTGLHYENGETALNIGDTLILYTDGIIEARHGREFFEEERLVNFIRELWPIPATEVPKLIFDEVLRFSGGRLPDDVALLALAYKGE